MKTAWKQEFRFFGPSRNHRVARTKIKRSRARLERRVNRIILQKGGEPIQLRLDERKV